MSEPKARATADQDSLTAGPRGPLLIQDFREPPMKVECPVVDRFNHREGNDDYTQAGNLFRLMSGEEKERLVGNIAGRMQHASREIRLRHFFRADPSSGMGVATGLGIDLASLPAMAHRMAHTGRIGDRSASGRAAPTPGRSLLCAGRDDPPSTLEGNIANFCRFPFPSSADHGRIRELEGTDGDPRERFR